MWLKVKVKEMDLRERGHNETGDGHQTQDNTAHITGVLSALSKCVPNPFGAIWAKRAEVALIIGEHTILG